VSDLLQYRSRLGALFHSRGRGGVTLTRLRVVTLAVAMMLVAASASAQRATVAFARPATLDQTIPGTDSRRPSRGATPAALAMPVAQERKGADPWFRSDKVKHFFVSFFIQSASYAALRSADVTHDGAIGGASAVTAGFGLGKELRDRRRGGEISLRDLVWDALGAGAASLLLARAER